MNESNTESFIREILKSQYHASLAMLRESIELCPDDLWTSTVFTNAFWQVAYHTLYFGHAYVGAGQDAFVPWEHHQADNQNPDGIPGPPDQDSTLPLIPRPYTKAQVLAYWQFLDDNVGAFVDALEIFSPECGFPRYRVPKLEHQMVNLRHIQHGAAQLANRLRLKLDIGVKWVGSRRNG